MVQPPINLIAVDLPIKDGDFPVRYGRLSYGKPTFLDSKPFGYLLSTSMVY
jgi:hypothetical protein